MTECSAVKDDLWAGLNGSTSRSAGGSNFMISTLATRFVYQVLVGHAGDIARINVAIERGCADCPLLLVPHIANNGIRGLAGYDTGRDRLRIGMVMP